MSSNKARLNNTGMHATRQYTDIVALPAEASSSHLSYKSQEEYVEANRSILMTPAEYYSERSTASIATDESNGYDRQEVSNLTNSIPKYFWIETLKNWCTFKSVASSSYKYNIQYYDKSIHVDADYYRRRGWELYVWDGLGTWVNFNELCSTGVLQVKPEGQSTKHLSVYEAGDLLANVPEASSDTQFYDFSRFKFISNFRIDSTFNDTSNYFTNMPDRSPAWLVARGLILTNDRDYSTIDSVSCQTIRISKTYARYHKDAEGPNDKWQLGQQIYASGCPMIWRLPSGELFLACDWQVDGPFDNDEVNHASAISTSNEDFVNQAARAFFGSGDNKTILKDWRNFSYHDESEERANSFMTQLSDDTLIASKARYTETFEFIDHATIKVKTNRSRVNGTVNTSNINTITRW